MSFFTSFISDMLSIVSEFLMSEPACYFVGIIMLAFIIKVMFSILSPHRF